MFKEIKISSNVERLDKFLVEEMQISRSQIKKMIDNGLILLNGEAVNKTGISLVKGDCISFLSDDKNLETNNSSLEAINLPIDIVYEDNDLMILNKPSGLLIHPTENNEKDTLAARIKYYFNNQNNHEFDNSIRPGIVHRLDKDTSGLIIVAKNNKILDLLQDEMKKHLVKRKYFAIVHNCFDLKNNRIFRINAPIGRSFQNKAKMQVNSKKDAKEAITIVKVLRNLSNVGALVECELITGRTHQIRAHMQYINHPIFNDKVYGIEKNPSDFGQYLMCHEIEFYHPVTKDLIYVNLDISLEFEEKISELTNEKN